MTLTYSSARATMGMPGWQRRVIRDPLLPERLLAKLWRAKAGATLRTTDGQTVEVIYPGRPAPGHGPDFRDAVLKLGAQTVKGPVELHRVPSDWTAHGHDGDSAYDNVVLHVVASTGDTSRRQKREEATVTTTVERTRPSFEALPTVVISSGAGKTPRTTGDGLLAWLVPLDDTTLKARLHDAGLRRFDQRASDAREALATRSADQVLFTLIADALGYSENRAGFAQLTRLVPLTVVRAAGHAVEPERRAGLIKRLLLGGAGLAEHTNEWDAIVGIAPMPASEWRTSGVRPANHPRRRIAALASYVAMSDGLGFAGWLGAALSREPGALLQTLTVAIADSAALVGEARAKEIAVNAVLPTLEAMGDPSARWAYESFSALRGNTFLHEASLLLGGGRRLRLGACEQQGLQLLYREAVAPDTE